MTGRQLASLIVALGSVALLLWRSRPAPVRAARVTAVGGERPRVAHVSLEYGGGLRPASAIVEVLGGGRVLGSATVPGDRQLLEIPIGADADTYQVTVTAAYRRPWGTLTRTA
jgi:hypothetical protein